jgi:hypothetical protein
VNFVLAAIPDHDANRHTDLDVRNIGIDDIRGNFWAFLEGDDGNNVGGPFLKIRVIGFIENDKRANCPPA